MKTTGFKKRVLLLACSNLLLQLMGFVYRMALTRYAGARALGLNSLIMQIYGIVVSVCISGLSVAGTNLAAGLHGSVPGLKRLLKTLLLVYCGLWLLAALPIFILRSEIASHALSEPGAADTLALMLVCIFMTGTENVLKSVHMGCGLVGRCAASELCEQGVRFALVILMLAKLPHAEDARTVFFIMLGMTMSEFVSVGFLGCSFLRYVRGKRTAETNEHPKTEYADVLRIALPASATAVASTVFASAAALLLPSRLAAYGLMREEALALIGVMNSVAVPIVFFPMAAVGALSSVLMPETARLFSEDKDSVRRLAFRAIRASALFALCAAPVIIAAAPYIARTLFGTEAPRTLFIMLYIKAAAVFPQVTATAVLNGAKKQGCVLTFAVCGELYQLALMLLLTPVFGIAGYLSAGVAGELLRLALTLTAVRDAFEGKEANKKRVPRKPPRTRFDIKQRYYSVTNSNSVI